jgi:hypothetical protein
MASAMKRVLAALAVVAICAGLAWLWNDSRRASRAARAGASAEPKSAAASARGPDAQLEPAPSTATHGGDVDADVDVAHSAAVATRMEVDRAQLETAVNAADLIVLVVDPDGAPREGIPLRLDPGAGLEEQATAPEPCVSDANGRAVFAGERAKFALSRNLGTLLADLPFDETPSLQLDAAALSSSCVRFVLPPGGELVARVRELDGAPAPNGSTLRLQLVPPHERSEPDLTGPTWKPALVGGAARFPWVQLGSEWELAAWRPKGTEPTRLRARGPRALGERVECELVFGSDQPVVQYRVLGPDGRPLPRIEFELARSAMFGSLEKLALSTDGEARFVLDGKLGPFASGASFTITYRPADGAPLMGRASLPAERAPGWNDGGEIRLQLEPLLVAGRVVNGAGEPVADAEVTVGEESHWFFGQPMALRGRSDARGAFELRGLWADERFRVRARTSNARSADSEVRQGATDVVLVLTPRYGISGALLVDAGVDPGWIRFSRVGADGTHVGLERKQSWGVAISVGDELVPDPPDPNRFELEPIEGGVFDLACLALEVEVARIPELAVHSDVDLGAIDLRGKIPLVEIELVGDGDLSGISGSYSWCHSGSNDHREGSFHGPLLRIASTELPIDVDLRPNGYRRALLERVRGRREYRLTAPLHARLVLQTAGALPPSPYRFDCELFQDGRATSQPDGARWFTAERNEIRCLVSSPGRHDVRWHLERKIEGEGFGGAVGSHVLREHWTEIEVLDVPGEQAFVVQLDADALNELVRSPPW